MQRDLFLTQSDEELARDCDFDFFKASGRGGQKRNKTSSAVRILHRPTQITVSDCSGRNQHRNRHEAFKKLRYQIALQVRCDQLNIPENMDVSTENSLSYPLFMARILDALEVNAYALSSAANFLGVSSARLVKIIAKDKTLWQEVNRRRRMLDLNELKL